MTEVTGDVGQAGIGGPWHSVVVRLSSLWARGSYHEQSPCTQYFRQSDSRGPENFTTLLFRV